MQMFLEFDEHAQYLDDAAARRPDEIIISSYGLYCGVSYKGHDTTKWGDKYQLRTRDFLESLRGGPDVSLLIGAPTYNSCRYKEKCTACEMKYAQQLFRFISHAELFPEFQWRVTTKLHLKCSLFRFGDVWEGIAGGRNFSDSDWRDITFELTDDQINILRMHTMTLWEQAEPTTNEVIGKMLEEQGISEQSLVALASLPK